MREGDKRLSVFGKENAIFLRTVAADIPVSFEERNSISTVHRLSVPVDIDAWNVCACTVKYLRI